MKMTLQTARDLLDDLFEKAQRQTGERFAFYMGQIHGTLLILQLWNSEKLLKDDFEAFPIEEMEAYVNQLTGLQAMIGMGLVGVADNGGHAPQT